MSAAQSLDELSPEVQKEIRLLAMRVTQGFPAFHSLKAVLTDREWRQIETELERYFPARPRSEDIGTRRPAVAASAEGSRSRSVPSTPARDKRTRKGKPFPSTWSRPSISKSRTDPAAGSSLPSVQHAAAPPARLAYYAIKTLMRLRQVSQCRAILDLAWQRSF